MEDVMSSSHGERVVAQWECLALGQRRRMIRNFHFSWVLLLVCALAVISPTSGQAQLQDVFRITGGSFANHVEYHTVDLPPGKEKVLADIVGPGKITYFYYTDDSNGHRNEGTGFMYPGLVLKVYWDDAPEPSIRVPLWAFFGAFERQTIDYQSLPMQINHYCYMSYLPMPFSTRARLVLANDGDEEYSRSVAYGIDYDKDKAFATKEPPPRRLESVQSDSGHAPNPGGHRQGPIHRQLPPSEYEVRRLVGRRRYYLSR